MIVDQFFATSIGTGALSTLSYANRILALILGMSAMAISRATLPIFSEAQAKKSLEVNVLTAHWTTWMFGIGVLVGLGVWVASPFIVKILFERGAFSAQNANDVARIMRYGLLQLPFYFAGIVCFSANSSNNKYALNGIAMIFAVIIKIASNYFLVPVLGLTGIQIGTAIMYLSFMAVFLIRKE